MFKHTCHCFHYILHIYHVFMIPGYGITCCMQYCCCIGYKKIISFMTFCLMKHFELRCTIDTVVIKKVDCDNCFACYLFFMWTSCVEEVAGLFSLCLLFRSKMFITDDITCKVM